MITDPYFYLCAIPAVLLFGMAKGGLGGGLAILSVPILSLVVSPLPGAAIMLRILVVVDAAAVWSFRHSWSRASIRATLPGALAGRAAAALPFPYLSEAAVKVLSGVVPRGFGLAHGRRGTAPQGRAAPARREGNWRRRVS